MQDVEEIELLPLDPEIKKYSENIEENNEKQGQRLKIRTRIRFRI